MAFNSHFIKAVTTSKDPIISQFNPKKDIYTPFSKVDVEDKKPSLKEILSKSKVAVPCKGKLNPDGIFSSSGPKGPMSLCLGVASVRPSTDTILIWFALSGRANFGTLNFYTEFWDFSPLINFGNLCKFIQKITKIASPSFLDGFSFCLFYLIGLGGGFKTCLKKKWNSIIMLIYANLFQKKNASSFLNRFWFALSGRAKLGTLNFYTEFLDFAPLINYGNLCKFMQIYSKNKNCFFSLISWPIFILFVLSDRARWRLQNLYTKFSKFINYANLCKCIQNHYKNHQKCFFISQPILIWFALSGRVWYTKLLHRIVRFCSID